MVDLGDIITGSLALGTFLFTNSLSYSVTKNYLKELDPDTSLTDYNDIVRNSWNNDGVFIIMDHITYGPGRLLAGLKIPYRTKK